MARFYSIRAEPPFNLQLCMGHPRFRSQQGSSARVVDFPGLPNSGRRQTVRHLADPGLGLRAGRSRAAGRGDSRGRKGHRLGSGRTAGGLLLLHSLAGGGFLTPGKAHGEKERSPWLPEKPRCHTHPAAKQSPGNNTSAQRSGACRRQSAPCSWGPSPPSPPSS